jgi:hypothetical protein
LKIHGNFTNLTATLKISPQLWKFTATIEDLMADVKIHGNFENPRQL